MDKKQIEKLAEVSYNKGKLDGDRVNKIIKHLSHRELNDYVKALKRQENRRNVYIDYSFDLSKQEKERLIKLFPDKIVIFRKDPDLVWGIRILEDDKVYNLNMKNALEQMKVYLNKAI